MSGASTAKWCSGGFHLELRQKEQAGSPPFAVFMAFQILT